MMTVDLNIDTEKGKSYKLSFTFIKNLTLILLEISTNMNYVLTSNYININDDNSEKNPML